MRDLEEPAETIRAVGRLFCEVQVATALNVLLRQRLGIKAEAYGDASLHLAPPLGSAASVRPSRRRTPRLSPRP